MYDIVDFVLIGFCCTLALILWIRKVMPQANRPASSKSESNLWRSGPSSLMRCIEDDLKFHGKEAVEEDQITTFLIRNLPKGLTQRRLIYILEETGFDKQSYNFLYLPMLMDFSASKGYGFINFPNIEDAMRFKKNWDGFQISQTKNVEIKTSGHQGLVKSIMQLPEDKLCIPRQYQPYVLGGNVSFKFLYSKVHSRF